MSNLILMLCMGFFCGLKTAGVETPESKRKWIRLGVVLCHILLLLQLVRLGTGRGEMFWIVFVLCVASGVSITISVFNRSERDMYDVIGMLLFILTFVALRISAITIITGIGLMSVLYPMPISYAQSGVWMQPTRRNIIRVVIVFGLVVFWFGAHESLTIDLIQILNWILDAL
jgi:hypothetical protein